MSCGYRSAYVRARSRHALTLQVREQYTAFDRWFTPITHRTPHTGHSAKPAPRVSAAVRSRNRRSLRHDLARHTAEQYTASGSTSTLNGSWQSRHSRPPACPALSDTTPG